MKFTKQKKWDDDKSILQNNVDLYTIGPALWKKQQVVVNWICVGAFICFTIWNSLFFLVKKVLLDFGYDLGNLYIPAWLIITLLSSSFIFHFIGITLQKYKDDRKKGHGRRRKILGKAYI